MSQNQETSAERRKEDKRLAEIAKNGKPDTRRPRRPPKLLLRKSGINRIPDKMQRSYKTMRKKKGLGLAMKLQV